MFAFFIIGLFFGVPALFLYYGRSTIQVYFYSWLVLAITLIAHALTQGSGDLSLALLSAIASSVLSFFFTSLVLFIDWMYEQS